LFKLNLSEAISLVSKCTGPPCSFISSVFRWVRESHMGAPKRQLGATDRTLVPYDSTSERCLRFARWRTVAPVATITRLPTMNKSNSTDKTTLFVAD
jgi:hypothetical protein